MVQTRNSTRFERRLAAMVAVALLVVGSYFVFTLDSGAQQKASPVYISADKETKAVRESGRVYFQLTFDNSGDDPNNYDQILSMRANFRNGALGYSAGFASDAQGTALVEVKDNDGNAVLNGVSVNRGVAKVIWLWVDAPADAAIRSDREIQVFGFDNYGHLTSGVNTTKKADGTDLILKVKGVKDYAVTVKVDEKSADEDNKLYQGESVEWGFTVKNTGYNSDEFTLLGRVYKGNVDVTNTDSWSFNFAGGNTLQISGSKISGGKTSYDRSVTITPGANTGPGAYEIEIFVRNSGSNETDTDRADVEIPLPDFEVTELTFSHSQAWITLNGDKSQEVTVFATIKNSGGNRDGAGVTTTNVDVAFQISGADVDGTGTNIKVIYIATLNHDDEETLSVTFVPNKAIDTQHADLTVQVLVDQINDPLNADGDVNIGESNQNNNDESTSFKVVQATSSTPSFSLGLIGLLGAALVLVTFAARFRRKLDDEDEE